MAPNDNQHRRSDDKWVKKAIEYCILIGSVASLTYGVIALKFAKSEEVDNKIQLVNDKITDLDKHNIKIDAKLDYIIETMNDFKTGAVCYRVKK